MWGLGLTIGGITLLQRQIAFLHLMSVEGGWMDERIHLPLHVQRVGSRDLSLNSLGGKWNRQGQLIASIDGGWSSDDGEYASFTCCLTHRILKNDGLESQWGQVKTPFDASE